ncbi:response regulator transcription factor [Actibacterium lipolyticum]|uniref:Response regulator MprA n=1 Tax=Actibacterium lipolyticum TaxID=1524263 RepID=A0A238JRE4_9RHOB|nr:response regulator transcription factor [Actibacterium lipolyticum]SMX32316.1 Response regulator MprA [Actibacterium lipolyticum]
MADTGRPTVLVVDDDPDIASVIVRGLELHGYDAIVEDRPAQAREAFRRPDIRAAIVDVMIGMDNGLDLVRKIRADGNRKPILVLSALSEVDDRAKGLKAGADDYVVKPFVLDELVARLKVQESRMDDRGALSIVLERDTRTVRAGELSVALTERECGVLEILMENAGHTVTRGELFDRLWTSDGTTSENIVDVYVGYLRKKLAPAEAFGVEIKTIRSRGFVLSPIGS